MLVVFAFVLDREEGEVAGVSFGEGGGGCLRFSSQLDTIACLFAAHFSNRYFRPLPASPFLAFAFLDSCVEALTSTPAANTGAAFKMSGKQTGSRPSSH